MSTLKARMVATAVGKLSASFPMPAGMAVGKTLTAMYAEACTPFTPAAVEEAARRFIAGEVSEHDGRFMPTPAQFAQACRTMAEAFGEGTRVKYLENPDRADAGVPLLPGGQSDKLSAEEVARRKEHVKDRLGYDPAQFRGLQLPEDHWLHRPEDKSKPWHDYETLKATRDRIAAYEKAKAERGGF